jgi:hypothetical protein
MKHYKDYLLSCTICLALSESFWEAPAMNGLTTALLERACRIFLERAYPEGRQTIPPPKSHFLDLDAEQAPETVLVPPVCQPLPPRAGSPRGYALRLGSTVHPHLKLQITDQEGAGCVFSVDTHDSFSVDPVHPDAARWAELQTANRRLKEQIERAWEEAGLLTFNALLRRELARPASNPQAQARIETY